MTAIRTANAPWLIPVAVAMLAVTVTTRADDAIPPGHAVAVRLDGSRISGPLLGNDGRTVRLGPGGDRRDPTDLPVSNLLALDLAGGSTASVPATVLEFANGDRLAAEIGATEEDAVAIRFAGQSLRVPLDSLRGITFRPLSTNESLPVLLFRETGENDLVVLTNGDRVGGQLLTLSETDLAIDADGREIRLPRDRIALIAFSPELTVARRIDGPRQIVQTRSGWLTVKNLSRQDDGSWQATTAFGAPIRWSADDVTRIQFAGPRVTFLSEIAPASVEFVPWFDRVWPVRHDRSTLGLPLTAGGTTFAKGLGVHSCCRLTYDLAGRYEAFHAVAGLAESAGAIGHVEFAVEVDGREVLRRAVSRRDRPVPLRNVDLRNVKTLVLTVDFGRNGDILDRANWCDAVLITAP